MTKLTGLCRETILNWVKQGIIGEQINQEDIFITATILKKSRRLATEDKKRIAAAIRSGQPLEKLLLKPKERKKRPNGRGEEAKRKARERLTELQKSLEKAELPKPSLGLKEAAEFLREISPGHYPSVATVEKIVKIAVILGDFPLPPEAVRATSGGRWQYHLTKRDLNTIFDVTLDETRNLPLNRAFHQAKENFQEERERRVPIETLLQPIFQQLGYTEETPERQKIRIRKFLIKKLQEKELPLNYDVSYQEILILGVLQEDKDDFIDSWVKLIQKKEVEKPTPIHIMLKTWPSLTGFLKEQLGLEKINPWLLADGVAWLETEGISVTTIQRQKKDRLVRYYRPSPEAQEKIKELLAIPEKREELIELITHSCTP